VELIGWHHADALSGICYSFAGGSADDNIVSLDDLIVSEETDRVSTIIGDVFSLGKKRWYNISGQGVVPRTYYAENFSTVFRARVAAVHRFVTRVSGAEFRADQGQLNFSGFSLPVVVEADVGQGVFQREYPSCVLHGDLHGGNLISSGSGRVSMIDYANVGFGPRFADAAALSRSVRLSSLENTEWSATSARDSAHTYHGELALLDGSQEGPYSSSTWFVLAYGLNEAVTANFAEEGTDPSLLLREMMVTYFLYALSIFELPYWNKAQKMRIIAWLGGLKAKLFPS
jgi:hypothetical protein